MQKFQLFQDHRKGRKNPIVQHAPPQNAASQDATNTEQPPTVLPADPLEWFPKDLPPANDSPAVRNLQFNVFSPVPP